MADSKGKDDVTLAAENGKPDANCNINISGAGGGIILTSPDGTCTKKIRLKNNGKGIEVVDP